ncbi:hypothetical protein BU23DRAFT_563584 [Bimuria novae-zelandiae CBS 107.79]|uniref:Uncharacterized protein n=1 Tax=Bimuria novae-zelandiae CBS 107.79 TaxID=1447943 RepID=A0A6A5VS52_9PLEO|nr:hypothetical protein BU23DRAFT_563584 [Bimuria novae-zelandiae CBS 107.79]
MRGSRQLRKSSMVSRAEYERVSWKATLKMSTVFPRLGGETESESASDSEAEEDDEDDDDLSLPSDEDLYASSATIQKSDTDWVGEVMFDILASSEDEVIESVAFGNLARDRRKIPRLKLILDHLAFQAERMPSIYHQQLVDKHGYSPTADQLREALSIAHACMFGSDHPEAIKMGKKYKCQVDDEMANELDRTRHIISMSLSRQSFRKFLWTESAVDAQAKTKGAKKPKPTPSASATGRTQEILTPVKGQNKLKVQKLSDARAQHALQFCDSLEQRLNDIPAGDRDKPLAQPLVEVGYSVRSIDRFKKHAGHESSNYLMNMFEAILEVLSRRPKNPFPKTFLEQHIIYLIWNVEQAEISEMGWTKLVEGYTRNAGGFSHYPAGQSNYSAKRSLHKSGRTLANLT